MLVAQQLNLRDRCAACQLYDNLLRVPAEECTQTILCRHGHCSQNRGVCHPRVCGECMSNSLLGKSGSDPVHKTTL